MILKGRLTTKKIDDQGMTIVVNKKGGGKGVAQHKEELRFRSVFLFRLPLMVAKRKGGKR